MPKVIKLGLVLLAVVSYCSAFIVLPLAHFHILAAGSTTVRLVQDNTAGPSKNVHPVSCAICSRINSVQLFVDWSPHSSFILPFTGLSAFVSTPNLYSPAVVPNQVRAPPFFPG